MLQRTLVLVDTSYLLASFYNSWEEGARGQLEISLATVVHRLDQVSHGLVDQPVQRQNWYDGIPDSGPHRYQRTLRVIEGVQLRAGQLIEWGDRRTQKAVDTLLVADMIKAAFKGHCSDMVLVSGDADMIPGVKVAVDQGVRVHLVGFGWDSISSALRHACDTTTVLDPRTDFHDSMQIRVLEGPIPPKVRTTPSRPAHPGEEDHDPEVEETVGMVDVQLRSDRAAATTVADEARQTVADEELAADAEELAADEQECATITETTYREDGAHRPDGAYLEIGAHRQPHGHDDDNTTGTPIDPSSAPAGPPSPASLAGAGASADTAPAAGSAAPAAPKPGPGPRSPQADSPAQAHAESSRVEASHNEAQAAPKSATPGPTSAPTPGPVPGPNSGSASAPSSAPTPGPTPGSAAGLTPGPTPNDAPGAQDAPRSDESPAIGSGRPNPSMMAPHRRPLRSKFVPLPEEVWTSSGEQTPFDVGQQYAMWWYEQAADERQRDEAHLLSGGTLPPAIDRPLLQFACQMLNEFTLTEHQRVHLRDGFHEGIRAVLLKRR